MSGVEARLAEVLAEHSRMNSTAGWNGSPDPSRWQNIRQVCICNEPLTITEDLPRYTLAHRAHVAAALAVVVAEEVTAARAEACRWLLDWIDDQRQLLPEWRTGAAGGKAELLRDLRAAAPPSIIGSGVGGQDGVGL